MFMNCQGPSTCIPIFPPKNSSTAKLGFARSVTGAAIVRDHPDNEFHGPYGLRGIERALCLCRVHVASPARPQPGDHEVEDGLLDEPVPPAPGLVSCSAFFLNSSQLMGVSAGGGSTPALLKRSLL